MVAGPSPPQPPAGTGSGWLVVRADGIAVAVDPAFAQLLGAPDPAALQGRYWPSLVTPRSEDLLHEIMRAAAAGERWSGPLELQFADRPVELYVEVLPAGDGVMLLRAMGQPDDAETAAGLRPEGAGADADAELRALVIALEAVGELKEPSAAARSVLQAASIGLAFDWAVVLLLEGESASVVCTYPSAMAGIQADNNWSPLDAAERQLLEYGEPSLTGALAAESEDRSPLARLPGFGMRSALRLPLYRGGRVIACVSLYSQVPGAFTAGHGVLLDRFVRPLAQRLGPPETVAELGAAPQSAAEPAPARRPSEGERPPATPSEVEPPRASEPPPVPGRITDPPEAQAERLTALGELVSGVAHELNNPLTAILGFAQMLSSLEGDERSQALNTIEEEAMRASRIVRNLFSFARQHRPRVEPIDINAVLQRVVDVRRYNLSVDNVVIETHFAELPEVMADEYQLEQVFLQLISNAHQAMLPDGGALTIRSEMTGQYVRVSIADTGPGIPPDIAPRIFDPFFTTRDVGRGSGMGLAIVYGNVAEHGGRIWAQQSPSGGAEFVVELPLPGAPTAPTAQPGAEPRLLQGRDERVLVVDDELAIRMLAREVLNTSGYRAEIAGSGDEALRLLEQEDYDLVIADVRMPGMDGVELYDRIGQRWPHLQRRLIFITGDVESDRTAALLREEDVRYLEKPFHTTQLLRAVRNLLDVADSESGSTTSPGQDYSSS